MSVAVFVACVFAGVALANVAYRQGQRSTRELPLLPIVLPDVPIEVVDATEPLFESIIRADVPFVVVWRDTRLAVHHWPVCMSAPFEAELLIDCAAECSRAAL